MFNNDEISLELEIQMKYSSVPHRGDSIMHTKIEKSSIYFFLKKRVNFTNI